MSVVFPPAVEAMIRDDHAPTCSIGDFLAAIELDDNVYWRVPTGHINNLFDDAVDQLEASRVKLAAADTFGTSLVIAVDDYSAKLQAIAAKLQAIAAIHQPTGPTEFDKIECVECGGTGTFDWPCETRAILDGPTGG